MTTHNEQVQRPYLGQRCHTSEGFGTIVDLTLDYWNGEPDIPTARIDLDLGGCPYVRLTDVELLATYPAG